MGCGERDNVDDLVDTSGSVDSLKVSVRCGLSPNARQIRPIVDVLSPDLSAICLRDQWVAWLGVSSSVATTTASTCSTAIDGGRPGRSSSISPFSRRLLNRLRHLETVSGCTPSAAATWVLGVPSAQASTILQRCASACDDFARRDQRSSVARSSSVSLSAALGGRPILSCNQPSLPDEFQAQDTSAAGGVSHALGVPGASPLRETRHHQGISGPGPIGTGEPTRMGNADQRSPTGSKPVPSPASWCARPRRS